jgi:hypothetical protein
MPTPSRNKLMCAVLAFACLIGASLAATPIASAQTLASGGASFQLPPPPPPPAAKATLVNGRVIAPVSAPERVRRVIEAANRLVEKPYRYGGGHQPFRRGWLDSGYDCSGAVSYALYGGRFLRSPLPSGALMSWGRDGLGQWITVYANGGHAYLVVAGLRFDTSLRDADAPGPGTGPRWSKTLREPGAFTARHPRGY